MNCESCGHNHHGIALAFICIGCPCKETPGKAEPIPKTTIYYVKLNGLYYAGTGRDGTLCWQNTRAGAVGKITREAAENFILALGVAETEIEERALG